MSHLQEVTVSDSNSDNISLNDTSNSLGFQDFHELSYYEQFINWFGEIDYFDYFLDAVFLVVIFIIRHFF